MTERPEPNIPDWKLWLARSGDPYPYSGPYFYNQNEIEELQYILSNQHLICAEINEYVNANNASFEPYFNKSLSTGVHAWKSNSFLFWTYPFRENIHKIPFTFQAFNRIPGLVSLSISVLEGPVDINEHRGDTNAIIRGHMGVVIPATLPECGIQVGTEQRSWEEGEVLLFNDAEKHKAWCNMKARRVVLIFDVIRDEFLDRKEWICEKVLGRLIFQREENKSTVLSSLPNWVKRKIGYPLADLVVRQKLKTISKS